MKRYAFSDIHGNYKLLNSILNYLEDDCEIYYLGDAADRGAHGIKCIERLLKDKRVQYIQGNHELMFLNAYREYKREQINPSDLFDYYFSKQYLWMCNGGSPTWDIFQTLSQEKQADIISGLINLKKYIMFTNAQEKRILLTHSGVQIEDSFDHADKTDVVWNRDHIKDTWPAGFEDVYEVHGHTPVISHYFRQDRVVRYANGHKLAIDMGTYISNRAAVIDLDSIGDRENEPSIIYFEEKDTDIDN